MQGSKFTVSVGEKFGRWTVSDRTRLRTKKREVMWLVRCDCGAWGVVATNQLTGGHSTGCVAHRWQGRAALSASEERPE